MKRAILLFFCIVNLATSARAANEPAKLGVEFDRIEANKAYFKGSPGKTSIAPIQLDLTDAEYLGALLPEQGGPAYLLFSGRSCPGTDCARTLEMYRQNGAKQTAFVYPGKILNPANGTVAMDSRAFFGRCLAKHGDVYVVFQRERVERRHRVRIQSSVYFAEAAPDHLQEQLIERHLPRITRTLRLVRAKVCHEIDGSKRFMSTKVLNIRPHDLEDDEDSDDGSDSKSPDPATVNMN